MSANQASLLVDCRNTLGEGLTWHARSGAWLWTDIESARLWRYDPGSGQVQSCRMPDRVGAFVVAQSGRLLLGLATGLAWATIDWARGDAAVETIAEVEADLPSTRLNDGRTDRAGNFVFGTMNEADGHAPIGGIYQYSVRHGLRRLDVGRLGIANSICFSPDGTTMYFCDSIQRRIMSCRYEASTASVRDIAPFVGLDPTHAMPDGSVVDADGALWNAQWGGAAVSRYAPDGRLLTTARLPVDHVTCPAFGGENLDIACVTTARMGVAQERLDAQPETGGVFQLEGVTARGIAEREFDDA